MFKEQQQHLEPHHLWCIFNAPQITNTAITAPFLLSALEIKAKHKIDFNKDDFKRKRNESWGWGRIDPHLRSEKQPGGRQGSVLTVITRGWPLPTLHKVTRTKWGQLKNNQRIGNSVWETLEKKVIQLCWYISKLSGNIYLQAHQITERSATLYSKRNIHFLLKKR